MRIECSHASAGNVYRIYRADGDFVTDMKRLIPFLNDCKCDVLVGGTDDDPDVVITVGPLDDSDDAAFQKRVRQHLRG